MGTRLHNGIANKLRAADQPIHDWYRFVLSFPPHLVRDFLDRFDVGPAHMVLDPFCGTGTTIVECKKMGIPSRGIEAVPMSHFACSVKTDWTVDPDALRTEARAIHDRTLRRLESEGLSDVPLELRLPSEPKPLRTLPTEKMRLILKNSISPLPLHKALLLYEEIEQSRSQAVGHLKLAFAKAVVESASNLHFGPEVGVRKPKRDAPMLDPWLRQVRRMAEDLQDHAALAAVPATVVFGDARRPGAYVAPASVDFVFTSPPYPNEKDYTRTTRLESVLLGFLADMQQLRDLKKGLLRSNTRNVYKEDDDDQHIAEYNKVVDIAEQIERRRIEMGKTSGFERLYARVTKLYFGGMYRHLADLRRVLKPGAILAYVVGDQASYLRIMIRTGHLLAEIAESLGYTPLGIDLFRTRLATATKEQLNEEVVLLRWDG